MPDPTNAIEDALIALAIASKDQIGVSIAAATAYAAAAKDLAEAQAWYRSPSHSH